MKISEYTLQARETLEFHGIRMGGTVEIDHGYYADCFAQSLGFKNAFTEVWQITYRVPNTLPEPDGTPTALCCGAFDDEAKARKAARELEYVTRDESLDGLYCLFMRHPYNEKALFFATYSDRAEAIEAARHAVRPDQSTLESWLVFEGTVIKRFPHGSGPRRRYSRQAQAYL
jgi:hypothetical protein